LTGDYNGTTELEVFAPLGTETAGWSGGGYSHHSWGSQDSPKVMFNGQAVAVRSTRYGSLVGSLSAPNATIATIQASIPALTDWKVADGLPERMASYNDSGPGWKPANKTSTLNPWQPETYPVLYADEYGFHTQTILWRARFTGPATGVYLNVIGGVASGWSAWLNGVFLGSTLGNVSLSETNATLSFGNATTTAGENVLFIIQDHMGHDETSGVLNPRGILNATLLSSPSNSENCTFTSWHVAGQAGGESNIDPIRGPLNEGGLHAERLGWHLPGFDDSAWESGSPQQGLSAPGAKFYRTNLPLDLPGDVDASLAFELQAPAGAELRAQVYVNGYMFGMNSTPSRTPLGTAELTACIAGKFIPYVGHQVEFPVFPGILDYQGNNTIGLSVWAQSAGGGSVSVSVKVLGVYQSSLHPGEGTEYLRPGWSSERLLYY